MTDRPDAPATTVSFRELTGATGRRLTRRRLLGTVLTGTVAALGGCLGDSSGESGTPTPGTPDPGTPTETPTDGERSPTPTTTETTTETHTETPTPTEPAYDLPVTGDYVPELAAVDEATVEYMQDIDVGAGAVAVRREGETVFERGYGWADRDRTDPLEPDTRFRIGSLSKRFTDDAVLRLVEAGDLALDDAVYPHLDVAPPDGELDDERIREITVEHLLNHEGGWNRFEHRNPLFNPTVVVDSLGLGGPPTRDDVARYVLDQPLQFAPGTDSVYSNLGYVLLGLVVESVTGTTYQSSLERELFDPAGVEDIVLGATRPENRPPDEVWYDGSEQCPNVYSTETDETASCADYGLVVSAFGPAGGHVSRTSDLARAMDALEWFWIDGEAHRSVDWLFEERDLSTVPWFGSLPGSFSFAGRRPDGWVVALFNARHPRLEPSFEIGELLGDALAGIDS